MAKCLCAKCDGRGYMWQSGVIANQPYSYKRGDVCPQCLGDGVQTASILFNCEILLGAIITILIAFGLFWIIFNI